MSGDQPGYIPPDHKTTAEFAAPAKAAGEADTTFAGAPVDEPPRTVTDLAAEAPQTATDLPAEPPQTATDLSARDAPQTVTDLSAEGAAQTATDVPFTTPGEPGTAPQAPEQPPILPQAPWTAQFGAGSEATAPGHGPVPPAAMAQPAPPAPAPMEHAAPPLPPAAQPIPSAPRPGGSRLPLVIGAAALAVLLLAGGVAAAFFLTGDGDSPEGKDPVPPRAASTAPSGGATEPGAPGGPGASPPPGTPVPPGSPVPSGAPTPGGTPPVQQPASPLPSPTTAPIGPLLRGKGITYQLVQQDPGYYEGRIVITNRGTKPMKAWKLTFDAPGRDVKNIWGARLTRGGAKAEIQNLENAPAIPPGGTWEIQYGAVGAPAPPKACRLNGKACGF
ncbi:cellulose binding domain-containing protein [Spirillospora albida]|uniref:cellulose binding domain-containing protein n=1 Tax=Spirillospora albida TaxID=58123 RepID=UPI0004C0AB5E|nr:cellulose binding domain-containing protein [Spirillospora albida]